MLFFKLVSTERRHAGFDTSRSKSNQRQASHWQNPSDRDKNLSTAEWLGGIAKTASYTRHKEFLSRSHWPLARELLFCGIIFDHGMKWLHVENTWPRWESSVPLEIKPPRWMHWPLRVFETLTPIPWCNLCYGRLLYESQLHKYSQASVSSGWKVAQNAWTTC